MLGTKQLFRLDKVPFSARGAYACIYEDREDHQLYLTASHSEYIGAGIPRHLLITFMDGDTELAYTYEATPTKLTVTTAKGTAEFSFQNSGLMRSRVKGISVWINYEPKNFEGCYLAGKELLHMEGGFGKFQFASVIPGTMQENSRWYFRNAASHPFRVAVTPAQDGVGDLALYAFYSNNRPLRKYIDFDLAHANTAEDFKLFCTDLPCTCCGCDTAKNTGLLAKYILWMSAMGPDRGLKNEVFYAPKLELLRTYMWQQPLIALAFTESAKTAWDYIANIFAYQDEDGSILDSTNDANMAEWVSSRMPIVGFAICYVLDHLDCSELKYMDYDNVYHKLCRYADWWMRERDFGKKGAPCYATGRDCGYYDTSLFDTGLPARTPDLLAYMALLFEACQKLAKLTRRNADAAKWAAMEQQMLDYLTGKLWDGKAFLVENAVTGECTFSASALTLVPIILGSRLPQEMLAAMTAELLNPDTYMTDCGIGSECRQSPRYDLAATARGRIVSGIEMLLLAGLKASGSDMAAKAAARKWCKAVAEKGFGLAIDPKGTAPRDIGMFSPDNVFYSLTAAAYLFVISQI